MNVAVIARVRYHYRHTTLAKSIGRCRFATRFGEHVTHARHRQHVVTGRRVGRIVNTSSNIMRYECRLLLWSAS